MILRREFIAGLGGAAAWPMGVARAQRAMPAAAGGTPTLIGRCAAGFFEPRMPELPQHLPRIRRL